MTNRRNFIKGGAASIPLLKTIDMPRRLIEAEEELEEDDFVITDEGNIELNPSMVGGIPVQTTYGLVLESHTVVGHVDVGTLLYRSGDVLKPLRSFAHAKDFVGVNYSHPWAFHMHEIDNPRSQMGVIVAGSVVAGQCIGIPITEEVQAANPSIHWVGL